MEIEAHQLVDTARQPSLRCAGGWGACLGTVPTLLSQPPVPACRMAPGGRKVSSGPGDQIEEQEESEPPEPDVQSTQRKSQRKRVLSQRLAGFDLGDGLDYPGLGVEGQRKTKTKTPKRRGRAGDYWRQPVVEEEEVDKFLADLRIEAEASSPGIPGPPPFPAFPASHSPPSLPATVESFQDHPTPSLARSHALSPSPQPSLPPSNTSSPIFSSTLSGTDDPTPRESEDDCQSRKKLCNAARRRLVVDGSTPTSRHPLPSPASSPMSPSLLQSARSSPQSLRLATASGLPSAEEDDENEVEDVKLNERLARLREEARTEDRNQKGPEELVLLGRSEDLEGEEQEVEAAGADQRTARGCLLQEVLDQALTAALTILPVEASNDQRQQEHSMVGTSVPPSQAGARGRRSRGGVSGRKRGGRGRGGRFGGGEESQGQAEVGQHSQDGTQPFTQPPHVLTDLDLPSLSEAHSTYIPTLKYVPKSARGEFARELARLWFDLAQEMSNERLWLLQFIMARCILPACRGPRVADPCSQGRIVKERLRRWREGEYSDLWKEAVKLTKRQPKAKQGDREDEKTQEQKNAERAKMLTQEAEYSRALQALTSAGMAPQTAATVAEMRGKHPAATSDNGTLPTTEAAPLSLTQSEVLKTAESFRRGSAPGPSGLRSEHIKCALKTAPNRRDRALQSLTSLANAMMSGNVPDAVAPFLCGARLHAGKKKTGGFRPIAVGNMLRRLVAKCGARKLSHRAATLLSPLQLGVGVKSGCEAILHAARDVLERNPDKWLLLVDAINAFNTANRKKGLQEVARTFPEILAWVTTCYGSSSILLFGNSIILSETGWHQGDPLASLLFAVELHPIVLKIKEEVPTLDLHAWFLDDGTQVGTVEELRTVVDILEREGPAQGLHISTAVTSREPKSVVWSPNHVGAGESDPLHRGIPREKGPGVTLLGAPLGSEDFVRRGVEEKMTKIKEITTLLPNMQDPHTEFVLLRACLALPKIMYTLRTVDTTSHGHLLRKFDRQTREALTCILGAPLGQRQWDQAKLPVALGGLGLRGAEDHAPGAYAASFLSSQTLSRELQGRQEEDSPVSLPQELLRSLTTRMGEEEEVTVAYMENLNQKAMSLKVDLNNLNLLNKQLHQDGRVREIARLASLSLPQAGAWLFATPIPALGLHLRPSEFTMAARYRLGCDVFESDGPCPACLQYSDSMGDHALCCGHGGERITRHNNLRDHLHQLAASAALNPSKESRFLLPGQDRRPADVFIPNWAAGLDAALDVTVVNPLQVATLAEAAVTPGYALEMRYKTKMSGAAAACQREGIKFLPLVVETLGGWHHVGEREVKRLVAAKARHSGEEEEQALKNIFTRLSILVMRGNAAILSNWIPFDETDS